jgi:hypothetical protein
MAVTMDVLWAALRVFCLADSTDEHSAGEKDTKKVDLKAGHWDIPSVGC